jgi:hypothetical protein
MFAEGDEMRKHGLQSLDKFECIGRRRSAWCTKAELSESADSEAPRRLPCKVCITSDWMCIKQ